jgi:DNA repair exonuclease SbcCD ATPase subunit
MVKVGIKNFRSYVGEDYTVIDFDRGMNLLSGASGRGKTTIFHAIQWALFKRPVSGNSPLYAPQKTCQTSVFLDLPGEMKITRSAPGGLVVEDYQSQRVLEDQEGQLLIEERFGKEHVWRSCNYIMQGTINPIISRDLTDSQRWDVLHSLAIPDQTNLENFKARIKEEFRKMEDERLALETELRLHQQTIQELELKRSSAEEELEKYPETSFQPGVLTRLTKTYPRLLRRDSSEIAREIDFAQTSLEQISERLTKVGRESSSSLKYMREIDQERDELSARLRRLERDLRVGERRRELTAQLDERIPELGPHPDKIQRAQKLFSRISWFEASRGSELLEVTGDQVDLQAWKKTREDHAKVLRREEIDNALKAKFPDQFRDLAPEDCWSEKVSAGRGDDGAMFGATCPGCSRGLRVFKNRLEIDRCRIHLSEREFGMMLERDALREVRVTGDLKTDSDIRALERKLAFDDQWRVLPEGLRSLIVKYKSLKPFELPDEEESSPADPHEITQTKIKLQNIDEEYRSVKRLIEEQNRERQALSNQLGDSETKIRSLKTKLREYEEVNRWWDEIEQLGFRGYDDLTLAWETSTKRQTLRARLLDMDTQISQVREKMSGITREKLTDISQRCEALGRLRDLAENAETEILKRCMYHLEASTNEFLENAFEHPISLHLGTEKESKTTSRKKHTLTVTVETCREDQQSTIRRSVDGFSGGETDRISLGFSMALTSLSKFPMIILDECISSLDTELRDKVIRALRSRAKSTNKSVILVCHDALEGLFDNVVNV